MRLIDGETPMVYWVAAAHPVAGGMLARRSLRFMLATGSAAPDFTITLLSGGEFTLSDLRGSRVVLFFFPGALTPG